MTHSRCYMSEPITPAKSSIMIVFGAGGDLMRKLLWPTIIHMEEANMLDEDFFVVGVAGHDFDDTTFRSYLKTEAEKRFHGGKSHEKAYLKLLNKIYYVKGRFENKDVYSALNNKLSDLAQNYQASPNHLFYLATPPSLFLPITKALSKEGMLDENDGFFKRVIFEKPFGNDLPSALALNYELSKLLDEHQIYRIDHYLGKETVQNLLAFRFANGIFEHIWNHHYVDHVQITVAESEGIGTRASFYDQTGALKDMVPNHCFQLLSLIAMEPPVSFESRYVRDEKTKLLQSVRPISLSPTCLVRAQYTEGILHKHQVCSYIDEDKVPKTSKTETYVALKLFIDNWRWSSVPFYLRTGKRLAQKTSEIVVQFKRPPTMMFQHTAISELSANQLILSLQPKEGITLKFGAKIPGTKVRVGDVAMHFNYRDYFGVKARTGYETLLYDCLIGDNTLFQRADMVEASWRVIEPILEAFKNDQTLPLHTYQSGSDGPEASIHLMNEKYQQWRVLGE